MHRFWLSVWVVLSLPLELLAPIGMGGPPPPVAALPVTSEVLPAWFTTQPVADPHALRNTQYVKRNAQRTTHHTGHHTIHPDDVTVSGPDEINNCDAVTFTVVATNDPFTTTNVIITSTMPTGFTPALRVFDVGTVGPNETPSPGRTWSR